MLDMFIETHVGVHVKKLLKLFTQN